MPSKEKNKRLTMRLQNLVFAVLSLALLSGCDDLRARRTLTQAAMLAQSKIVLLQNAVRNEHSFDLQTLNEIFHKDALEANVSIEEKMRSFYEIDSNVQISLLGELIKTACPEFGSIELTDNCYFVKKIAKEKDFEHIEAIVVYKKGDSDQEHLFFKSNYIDGKIELEKSRCCSKPLLQYLSIMPSGKIANPQYEKQLLRKIHGHRSI